PVLAAPPRPAGAAVVLDLARLLQPRAYLRLGPAHLSAAAVPARPHARAEPPGREPLPAAAAAQRAAIVAGVRDRVPSRLSHRLERRRLQRDRRRLCRCDRRAEDRAGQAPVRLLSV